MNVIKIFGIVTLSCAGYIVLDNLILPALISQHPETQSTQPVRYNSPTIDAPTPKAEPMMHENFSAGCDGHTHCSQMHSCEEAKQWLSRCPNAEMDGDGDGVPCERQWCKSIFN